MSKFPVRNNGTMLKLATTCAVAEVDPKLAVAVTVVDPAEPKGCNKVEAIPVPPRIVMGELLMVAIPVLLLVRIT